MRTKCARSCDTCDYLDWNKRCPPTNATPAVEPGSMAAMFERALADFPQYKPQALSKDPYVVSFDNFVSADEIAALLSHTTDRWVRSTASGGRSDDDEFIPLESDIRTSDTTWCNTKECLEDPQVRAVSERMVEITQLPSVNHSEFMQFLRYKPCASPGASDCQFYRAHHDTIPELGKMPCGPRVYTFFLYLSDVEEGGGTRFTKLGFDVQPRAGSALLWPATYNDRPFESDPRTMHEALPPTKGTKFAANFWLHQYDYVKAHEAGCTA